MPKRYFTYADVMLDKRWVYTPSHTIYIPTLIGKAEVFDEAKMGISTPDSLLNFWYINQPIPDWPVSDSITKLMNLPNMHWITEISQNDAKQMLLDNWFTEVSTNTIELHPEYEDELTWETVPAVLLVLE